MSESGDKPFSTDRWKQVEALFHRALDLPKKELDAFFLQECGDDAELREILERLVLADTLEDALVDHSLEELALPLLTAPGPAPSPPVLDAGTRVGRYRLIEVLGTGGMGTVYRAERADGAFDRQVALKVVHTSRLGDEAARRLRQERQILARLDHPGIATLLDGGLTEEGLPYFAMELVKGTTLTDFAARRNLSTQARLRLMIQVAEAVDFAHRNLIVHRDLKPSNILVTDAGVVKLLDFGIARLLDDDADDGATRTGLALLTPEYAAPEQIRGDTITTAADVYGLGAVLYELLSGRRPFGRVAHGWRGLERILNEEPPPLSRAEGLDRSDRRALEGDLTTITAKALQKDPGRRYASARALSDDLTRFLEGRPVTARPDSVAYRTSKFVRRNRLASGLAAAAIVAVFLGGAGTLWQAREARMEAQRAQAVGDFLFSLFEGADPDLHPGDPVTANELLEAGLARVDSLQAGPEVRADLLTTLGILFGKLGHDERAEPLLRQAVDESLSALGERHPTTGRALDALGTRLGLTGDPDEGVAFLERALAVRRANGATLTDVGTTQGNLAKALENAGRYEDAIATYQAAIETLEEATGGDSLAYASELMGLAQAYEQNERFEEADPLMRAVLRLRQTQGDSPSHATALHNLGHLMSAWHDNSDSAVALHSAALEMWRRMFPAGHPEVSRSMEQIARIVELRGEWDRADSLYAEALTHWSDLYGDVHPHLAAIRANQANLRYRRGELGQAAEAYVDIVRIYRATGEIGSLAVSVHNLGVINRAMGNFATADSLIRQGLA
ncbi:MAG: serine/threonine-protein kinase, partial [Gemmatimonadota bacterium]|nr:serine/threonine-protein kinase [Gemmatimonadota bacterium]